MNCYGCNTSIPLGNNDICYNCHKDKNITLSYDDAFTMYYLTKKDIDSDSTIYRMEQTYNYYLGDNNIKFLHKDIRNLAKKVVDKIRNCKRKQNMMDALNDKKNEINKYIKNNFSEKLNYRTDIFDDIVDLYSKDDNINFGEVKNMLEVKYQEYINELEIKLKKRIKLNQELKKFVGGHRFQKIINSKEYDKYIDNMYYRDELDLERSGIVLKLTNGTKSSGKEEMFERAKRNLERKIEAMGLVVGTDIVIDDELCSLYIKKGFEYVKATYLYI